MNLYMVKYKQWNSYFSENYERERLSVGNNKYEAIPKVKETVSKDAREFAAEKISAVFGYEVKISSELIRYDKRYDGIMKSLLGRVAVVDNIDSLMGSAVRQYFSWMPFSSSLVNPATGLPESS